MLILHTLSNFFSRIQTMHASMRPCMLVQALMRAQPPADLLLLPRGLTYVRLWFRSTYAIDIHFRFANAVVLEGMHLSITPSRSYPNMYTHIHTHTRSAAFGITVVRSTYAIDIQAKSCLIYGSMVVEACFHDSYTLNSPSCIFSQRLSHKHAA